MFTWLKDVIPLTHLLQDLQPNNNEPCFKVNYRKLYSSKVNHLLQPKNGEILENIKTASNQNAKEETDTIKISIL